MRRTVLVVLAAGLLLGADNPKGEAKKDQDKLQGEWTLESGTREGTEIPEDIAKSLKRTIKDDGFSVTRDGQALNKGTFKLDPSKKPKAIDFITTEGPGKGTKALMLYELKGDELRLCETTPDDTRKDLPRPAEFSAGPGSGRAITTLRRTAP